MASAMEEDDNMNAQQRAAQKNYKYGCFAENNKQDCHNLAESLEEINDFSKASKIYKSNCEDNRYGESCFCFANLTYMGKGLARNLEKSFEYYEKACSMDYVKGCLFGGTMCVSGSPNNEGFPLNYPRGMEMLQKACDMKNPMACFYLAGMYMVGEKGHFEKSKETTFKYTKLGCEYGNQNACRNLANMYRHGEGVSKDLEKAEKIEFDMKAKAMMEMAQHFHNKKH